MTSIEKKQKPSRNLEIPEWLPPDLFNNFNETDLEFHPFCTELFAKLEAAKRENFPKETMRVWFIEFVRRGWTKKMVLERYNALLTTKIYGVEKLDFADWANVVETFAKDEMQLLVKQQIESMLQRGRYLLANKEKVIQLTDENKKSIDVALAKEIEFELRNEKYRIIDDYKVNRKKELKKIKDNETTTT